MKIDWKRKLASRKFWASLAGWITSLLTAFHATENLIAQVSLLIAGIGALVVYVLAEGYVDGRRGREADAAELPPPAEQ